MHHSFESHAYILIYFLKGSLPWQNLTGNTKKDKYDEIMKKKMEVSTDVLCSGIPQEFKYFLDEVKKIGFTETPHYSLYREVFRELFIREGYSYDYIFDWNISEGLPVSKSFSNGFIDHHKNSQLKLKITAHTNLLSIGYKLNEL